MKNFDWKHLVLAIIAAASVAATVIARVPGAPAPLVIAATVEQAAAPSLTALANTLPDGTQADADGGVHRAQPRSATIREARPGVLLHSPLPTRANTFRWELRDDHSRRVLAQDATGDLHAGDETCALGVVCRRGDGIADAFPSCRCAVVGELWPGESAGWR